MVYNEVELVQKSITKFSQFGSNTQTDDDLDNCFGEIIHDGKLSWLAKGAHLEVFSLKNGQRICSYHFDSHDGLEKSIITTVTEIECANENCCFLAVGLQISDSIGSIIAIYSVQGSKILRCIEISDRITCCSHISEDITKRTFLQLMQGCLAIGTDIGKLILLDINFKKCEDALLEEVEDVFDSIPCHMVKSSLDFTHISDHYKHTIHENFNFGIELEQVGGESFVLSLLPVPSALSLIAGLEDGRMIIYDLTELQILYIVLPQEHQSPLSKMTYLQPQDDPRAMIYIWAFHENVHSCFAVMHCLEYEKKVVDDSDNIILFEEFQTSHVKLVLSMNEKNSLPIRCQSITKCPNKEDDYAISLCMLAWKAVDFTQLLIFDMNQWYKEEMPEGGNWREHLTYLSPFQVKNLRTFDVYFDKNTVSHFKSVQRIEEHFYPISLTFDFVFLLSNSNIALHWPGLQYKALDNFNLAGTIAILEPNFYFNEIKAAYLLPQYFENEKKNKQITLGNQREILLSVALEYNCIGLLKNCARNWADGSCIGQKPNEGLSLSTLTDWIWKRAGVLKQRCNTMCVCLFDFSGRLMDQHSKKELFHLTRQLKLLADLLEIILTNSRQHIPNHIFEHLESQLNSIRMVSEYQEVLQWLLNIGLLPEGSPETSLEYLQNENEFLVPYPYKMLNNYYKTQRLRFSKINQDLIKARTNSCRLLYIDSFIEHRCNIESLKEHWQIEHGQPIYPPTSMQTLLRTLLIPNVPLEVKHSLLIYAFLDLNMAVMEENYAGVVQNLIKFPAVFKLNASLIKTVQAFWNLDHGQFEIALEEIVCPFLHEKKLEQWEQELFIESLLVQENPSLALRALQAHSAPVNSTLTIKVYVANNLISEAFHLARSKKTPELMKTFVRCCEYVGKWNVLRDLALTEEEEKIVEELLKESKYSKQENIYLMYMLQKSKYIEAKTYLDEMRLSNINRSNFVANTGGDLELSKTLLGAYNCTMTPLSKNLNECYYGLRNKVCFSNQLKNKNKEKLCKPFSADLLKETKRTYNDGLFQSSILSIDDASNYWNEKSASSKREERMMQTNNVAFVRKPQLEAYDDLLLNTDILAYPETFKEQKKRRLDSEDDSIDSSTIIQEDLIQENRKKRIKLMESEKFSVFRESEYDTNNRNNKIETTSINSNTKDLLNTPIVRNCRFMEKERLKNSQDKIITPQSILKIKSLIRPNSPSVLRPVTISSSKPIEYEYTESENASDLTESEKDDKISYSINLEKPSRKDETLELYQTNRSEQTYFTANDENETKYYTISPPKSEIFSNSTIPEKATTTGLYANSRGRKSIRTPQKNNISTSETEFLSLAYSTTSNTNNYSIKDCNLESNIKNNPSSEIVKMPTTDKSDNEISKDSGAIMISDLSSVRETRSMRARLAGPKARRPLRRSATPPKLEKEKKVRSKRITRSEEMSDSDAFPRVKSFKNSSVEAETKSYATSIQPPTLSRLVVEKNLLKNLASLENDNKNRNISKSIEFREITEYKSELYKTSTNEFNPLTSSSKVEKTLSKFVGYSEKPKLADQTTIVGDISLSHTTETDDRSRLEESRSLEIQSNEKKSNESLMSTVEMTNTSLTDTTNLMSKDEETTANEMNSDYHKAQNKDFTQGVAKTSYLKSNKESSKGIKSSEVMESEEDIEEEHENVEDEYEENAEDDYEEIVEDDYEDNVEDDYEENNNEESSSEEEDRNEADLDELENEDSSSSNNNVQTDYIDIASDTENFLEAFSSKSETETTLPSNDNAETDNTSQSSSEYYVENSDDLMYNDYLMDEIVTNSGKTTTTANLDRPISISSSLDSTLEISNEDTDISRTDSTDTSKSEMQNEIENNPETKNIESEQNIEEKNESTKDEDISKLSNDIPDSKEVEKMELENKNVEIEKVEEDIEDNKKSPKYEEENSELSKNISDKDVEKIEPVTKKIDIEIVIEDTENNTKSSKGEEKSELLKTISDKEDVENIELVTKNVDIEIVVGDIENNAKSSKDEEKSELLKNISDKEDVEKIEPVTKKVEIVVEDTENNAKSPKDEEKSELSKNISDKKDVEKIEPITKNVDVETVVEDTENNAKSSKDEEKLELSKNISDKKKVEKTAPATKNEEKPELTKNIPDKKKAEKTEPIAKKVNIETIVKNIEAKKKTPNDEDNYELSKKIPGKKEVETVESKSKNVKIEIVVENVDEKDKLPMLELSKNISNEKEVENVINNSKSENIVEKPDKNQENYENILNKNLIDIRKVRAQSVDLEISKNTYNLRSPKRSIRAASEQHDNTIFEKVKKVEKKVESASSSLNSPSVIMTRRRSRLLDRIEEENILETPTKTASSRKRLISHESENSENSFTLNIEPDTPPSVSKRNQRRSLSSNLDDTILQTPSSKDKNVLISNVSTPRRSSRSTSLAKELPPVVEALKAEEVLTPSRRHSRRLSMQKDTSSERDDDTASNISTKKARRNSFYIEDSEAILTPRKARATSSLRELVLTPKRSSRKSISQPKDLSPFIKEENTEQTSSKNILSHILQNESTPKQLFKSAEPESAEKSENSEANTSTESKTNKTEDYSMERRLTRTQKSLLAKSANIKAIDQSTIPLKKRNREELDKSFESMSPSKNDDTASIISTRSRRSTASRKQSTKNSKNNDDQRYYDDEANDNDDLDSTVSSFKSGTSNKTPRKRKTAARGKLKIITEKDEDIQKNSSDVESNSTTHSGPKLRTRKAH